MPSSVRTHEGVVAERLRAFLVGERVDRAAILVQLRLRPELQERIEAKNNANEGGIGMNQ